MNKTDDGGDAFPVPCANPFGDGRMAIGGMTLRDYFAAKAMQARIIALGNHLHQATDTNGALQEVDKCHAETAERAYRHADSMLAERAK